MPNLSDARSTYASSLAFLVSRDEIPLLLNARGLFGCGAEIGVKKGSYSSHLLRHWRGHHLLSIDPWRAEEAEQYRDIANVTQAEHESFYETALERMSPYAGRSTVWRMTSLEAAERIPHHSLDFVYLDARHDYASVVEDLEAWFDKVRPGGILAGHDYFDGEIAAGVFAVRSAVDEFFAARGLAVYSTIDDEPCVSWMVEIPAPAGRVAGADLRDEVVEAPADEQVATLAFDFAGEHHEVRLILDPSQMSQRMMLEAITSGSLHEPETSLLLARVLRPGDTFIDVGGHVGYFSVLASTLVGPSGRVLGFEPETSNFQRLSRNVEVNEADNVEVVNMAVGERTGTVQLHVNADNDGGHALWDVGTHDYNARSRTRPEVRPIPLTSLDEFLADRAFPPVKLIKIDAEGSEHRVLSGAAETLRRLQVPFVVLEINDFALSAMGSSEREIRELMAELGYETYALLPNQLDLLPLERDQWIQAAHVYNLLFRHESAPQIAAA